MDVSMAAFRLVHDWAGGASALGPVINKSGATLSHEVSPSYQTAKLGLVDAVKLSAWTGDRQVLNAFAAELGCMVVPLVASVPGTESAAARIATLAREFGELMGACASGLADGQVSDNERERIEREGGELLGAVQAVLAEVRAMNAAGKQQREPLQAVA